MIKFSSSSKNWRIIPTNKELALTRGNFTETQQLLKETKLIAQNQQLGNLITKVEQEENEFNEEFQKWSDLVNKNTSIGEMMEKTKTQKYIAEALTTKEKTLGIKTNFYTLTFLK
ncbi:MAG: hypothetical protein ACW967_07055 [Candidatus Hodarchaeales archaeon]|jgi:hypothetical protein